MDIPSPEVVLMEAMFDDKTSENVIKQFEVIEHIKAYSGVPVRWAVGNLDICKKQGVSSSLWGVHWKVQDMHINLANRQLHPAGWHLSQEDGDRRGEKLLCVAPYKPPTGLAERLKRAWAILRGAD